MKNRSQFAQCATSWTPMLLALTLASSCSSPHSRELQSTELRVDVSTIRDGLVETGGSRLYYKTMGSGEPIVLLHGGPGFDHRQFLPHIWDLASEHQVILFDQRGTGFSSGPVDATSITIENFIEDIEAIREALGLARMNLFGHSWGGRLAILYALQHPDKLKSLILASTAASSSGFDEMGQAIRNRRPAADTATLRELAASEAYREQDPEAIERFWGTYFKVYFADPALVEALDLTFTDNTIRYAHTVAGLISESAGEPYDLHQDLTTLGVPTLILHGDSDPLPLRSSERIHTSLPNSELTVLERSGHWIFADAMDQITAAVGDFLVALDESS